MHSGHVHSVCSHGNIVLKIGIIANDGGSFKQFQYSRTGNDSLCRHVAAE